MTSQISKRDYIRMWLLHYGMNEDYIKKRAQQTNQDNVAINTLDSDGQAIAIHSNNHPQI